jgi:spermidine synthase
MEQRSPSSVVPLRIYLGIFLVSLSVIVYEIALTKIFSVILWYHFAYLAVSLALFGLGGGGLLAFFFQERWSRDIREFLGRLGLRQMLAIVLCLVFILNVDFRCGSSAARFVKFFLIYLIGSLPFVAAGAAISLVFRSYPQRLAKLYFFDLVGSGIGCFVLLVGISVLSGPAVILLASAFAGVAAFCFSPPRSFRLFLLRLGTLLAFWGVLLIAGQMTPVFKVKFTKTYQEGRWILFEKWSPLARITVWPRPVRLFGWGMSRTFAPRTPVPQLWIEQDACAGSPIVSFDGNFEKVDFLKHDVTSFVYHVKPRAKTFVVGAGGGRDVLTALAFGSPNVVACDINPVIIDLIKNKYRSFTGGLYHLPQVRVETAEARHAIRSSREKFDVIQISLIDSWAATVAGAFSLAENSLYTVEAFKDYLDHLSDDGFLSVTRYLFYPRNQSLRVVTLARAALEQTHVREPWRHVAVVATDFGSAEGEAFATILVKKSPLTPREAAVLRAQAEALGFIVLYLPGYPVDKDFSKALLRPLSEVVRESYYDVRPPTDDRPFFFQMVYFSRAFDMLFGREVTGQRFNYYAQSVILSLVAIALVLLVFFYMAPLFFSRRAVFISWPWGSYFILLGLGFMFVEIPLLQKGSLYLGHPTYSISVVLFSMLVSAGLGSLWSSRIPTDALPRRLPGILLAASFCILAVMVCMEFFMPRTIGLSLISKAFIMIGVVGLVAFFLGACFPSGLRLVNAKEARAIPWVWALNGAASVLGSIIAMAVAMCFGYRLTLFLGALIYLAAQGSLWYLFRRANH